VRFFSFGVKHMIEKTEKKQSNTRQRLLSAASRIIIRDGVNSLTLDAVAHSAEVSKGGLLYHFPSKDLLIQGIVQQLLEDFDKRMDDELAESGEPVGTPGRWLRAYIRATLSGIPYEREVSAALAVAMAAEPKLLESLRDAFMQIRDQADHDGVDPGVATLVRLSVDGLWFSDVLQLAPLDPSVRATLIERLIRLTEEGAT
jgi:AcrR family transcriptional regulator